MLFRSVERHPVAFAPKRGLRRNALANLQSELAQAIEQGADVAQADADVAWFHRRAVYRGGLCGPPLESAAGTIARMSRLPLAQVTLCAIDTRAPALAAQSLLHSMSRVDFARVYLFTNRWLPAVVCTNF